MAAYHRLQRPPLAPAGLCCTPGRPSSRSPFVRAPAPGWPTGRQSSRLRPKRRPSARSVLAGAGPGPRPRVTARGPLAPEGIPGRHRHPPGRHRRDQAAHGSVVPEGLWPRTGPERLADGPPGLRAGATSRLPCSTASPTVRRRRSSPRPRPAWRKLPPGPLKQSLTALLAESGGDPAPSSAVSRRGRQSERSRHVGCRHGTYTAAAGGGRPGRCRSGRRGAPGSRRGGRAAARGTADAVRPALLPHPGRGTSRR